MNETEVFSTFLVDDDDEMNMDMNNAFLKTPAMDDAKYGRRVSSSTWQNSTPTDSPSPFSGTTSSESANSPHSNFSHSFSPHLSYATLDHTPIFPSKLDNTLPDLFIPDSLSSDWTQWTGTSGLGTVSPSELVMKPSDVTSFQSRKGLSPAYFEPVEDGNLADVSNNLLTPSLDVNPFNLPINQQIPLPSLDMTAPMSTTAQYSKSAEWYARRQALQTIAFGAGFDMNGRSEGSSQDTSPEPDQKKKSRKRKSVALADGSVDIKQEGIPPPKKTAHNMIEKRYRTNLNDKIAALRDSVPSLRVVSKGGPTQEIADGDDVQEDLDGLTPAHKLNKATVMAKATEYIKHLEKRGKCLNDENDILRARLEAFEQLAKMGSPEFAGLLPESDAMPQLYQPPNLTLQVPEISRRPSAARPATNANKSRSGEKRSADKKSGTGVMGKLVVGSLGGLMMVQGFREHDGSSHGRELFAIPWQPLRWLANSLGSSHVSLHIGGSTAHLDLLTLIRVFLFLGAIVFFLSSWMSEPKPDNEKEGLEQSQTSIAATTSPLENRRKAWLTATQTVWVSQRSFFANFGIMTIKATKLLLRNILGWRFYCLLGGSTDEQEFARIKAWDIAIDAQLAGGDSEICAGRLTMTLLASFTVPKTANRLMLRALHLRILHWRLASGSNGLWVLQDLVDFFAEQCWNKARALHEATTARTHGKVSHLENPDMLPEHLSTLLGLEYDDVFADSLMQRAYNLSFNRPTAQDVEITDAHIDAVVNDFAVRSSLDALAAWWSGMALNSACARVLTAGGNVKASQIKSDISLAEKVAPPDSGAQQRAHVAKIAFTAEDGQSSLEYLREVLEELDGISQPPTPSVQRETTEQRTLQLLTAVSQALSGDADLSLSARCASALAFARSSPRSPSRRDIAQKLFNSVATYRYFHLSTLGNVQSDSAHDIGQLGFTTAWKALEVFANDEELAAGCTDALETIAGGLRIWIGGEMGRKWGLDKKDRAWAVEACLKVSKRVIGIKEDNKDLGYESQSESKEELAL